MKNIAIFISGRGSNMKAIIDESKNGILRGLCRIKLVFSNKLAAPGIDIAKKYSVPTLVLSSKKRERTEFDKELYEKLKKYNLDYIILAGYMRIISPYLIDKFPNRIINIHPADTNKHRGLHGYKWAFDNRLSSTKITVHYVDEGLDTGKIIAQKEVDISGCNTLSEVEKKGLAVEHKFYSRCLKRIFTE